MEAGKLKSGSCHRRRDCRLCGGYALILAWNFAPEIMDKNAAFRQAGGRFIVPVPDIELV